MEKEEGEMSDDNAMLIDDVKESVTEKEPDCTVLYKAGKEGVVVERLEKIDATKLEERVKRFGLNLSGSRLVSQAQIDELYARAGITGNERHYRFDTLHLNGVDGLSTREIFEYLEDYRPVSLERVDDVSCNIVCQDHISAAIALLVHSREIRSDEINKMLSEKSHHHWREGMPHPKKDLILMRFATNGDKKMARKKPDSKASDECYDQSMDSISKNPWGDLCKSWGVYDHQEIFQRKLPKNDYEDEEEIEDARFVKIKSKRMALRLGKRSHKQDEPEESSSDSEWKKKSKTPRMRMHADDEESNQKKKQVDPPREKPRSKEDDRDVYAPLSIEVINSRSHYTPRKTTKLSDKFKSHVQSDIRVKNDNIQSRLSILKVVPMEKPLFSDNDDASSDDSDHNVTSRVQRVSSVARSMGSVWSRLDAKQSTDTGCSDLRQMLKSRKGKKTDDLRKRLGKPKKTNLRIEIDNHYESD